MTVHSMEITFCHFDTARSKRVRGGDPGSDTQSSARCAGTKPAAKGGEYLHCSLGWCLQEERRFEPPSPPTWAALLGTRRRSSSPLRRWVGMLATKRQLPLAAARLQAQAPRRAVRAAGERKGREGKCGGALEPGARRLWGRAAGKGGFRLASGSAVRRGRRERLRA